eukprot:TRINITY_DN2357_c0_g1_i2.p1 TRINITY_DN2357_c0_g1~~TRINITY_DN2357_c0_g1_i2.p1  ORF type:complete len:129 (-),score=8.03 TRINITY_DN2357_c0_g1_i2:23-409(-)
MFFIVLLNIEGEQVYISKRIRSPSSGITSEFHVVYSPSYQVPIIYLRHYDPKGQLVLDSKEFEDLIGQYLSPVPHPLNGSPFLHIHPCKTSELMGKLTELRPKSYLLSFLSTMGPYVGLYLGLEYAQK